MISKRETQELRQLAASEAVREEFRLLQQYSLRRHAMDLDQYVRFLTTSARLFAKRARKRALAKYTQAKL